MQRSAWWLGLAACFSILAEHRAVGQASEYRPTPIHRARRVTLIESCVPTALALVSGMCFEARSIRV